MKSKAAYHKGRRAAESFVTKAVSWLLFVCLAFSLVAVSAVRAKADAAVYDAQGQTRLIGGNAGVTSYYGGQSHDGTFTAITNWNIGSWDGLNTNSSSAALSETFTGVRDVALVGNRVSNSGALDIAIYDQTDGVYVINANAVLRRCPVVPGDNNPIMRQMLFYKSGLDESHVYKLDIIKSDSYDCRVNTLFLNPPTIFLPGANDEIDFGAWKENADLYSIYTGEGTWPSNGFSAWSEFRPFAEDKISGEYTYLYPAGATAYPAIKAFPSNAGATAEVIYPAGFPGKAEIRVTPENGDAAAAKSYYINFVSDSGVYNAAGQTKLVGGRAGSTNYYGGQAHDATFATITNWNIGTWDGLNTNSSSAVLSETFTGVRDVGFVGNRVSNSGALDFELYDQTAGAYVIKTAAALRRCPVVPGNNNPVMAQMLFYKSGLDMNHVYKLDILKKDGYDCRVNTLFLNPPAVFIPNDPQTDFGAWKDNADLYSIYTGIGTWALNSFNNWNEFVPFAEDKTAMRYIYTITPGMKDYPSIQAFAANSASTVEIIKPQTFPGTVEIKVTPEDGNAAAAKSYYIEFASVNPSGNNDASVSDILVNGIYLKDFDPDRLIYDVVFPIRQNPKTLPELEITLSDPHANYTLSKPKSMPCSLDIDVTAENGIDKRRYTLNYIISDQPEKISADVTWIDAPYNGKTEWGQNFIRNMVVTPAGDIRTWSEWDEGGHRFGTYDKNGRNTGSQDFSRNDPNYYARRAVINGTTWSVGSGDGLTDSSYEIDDHTVYRWDGANRIPFPYSLGRPTAIAKTNDNLLMIADDSIPQILFFDVTDPANPVLKYRFGNAGGISAGTPGLVDDPGYIKLWGMIAGVGMDAEGTLYVGTCMNAGGTTIRSFTLDGIDKSTGKFAANPPLKSDGTLEGAQNWLFSGIIWCDIYDFDRSSINQAKNGFAEPEYIYGDMTIYKFDPTAPKGSGKEYKLYAFTLDHNKYPEDPRISPFWDPSVYCRQVDGATFLYVTNMYSRHIMIYRFEGLLAVPSGLLSPNGNISENVSKGWPDAPFIWRDENGDKKFEANEFKTFPRGGLGEGFGAYVDTDGTAWFTTGTTSSGVLQYTAKPSLDEWGNPVYEIAGETAYDMRSDWQLVRRTRYIPETDTMYMTGYLSDGVLPNQGYWQCIGRYIIRYDNWFEKNGPRTVHRGYPQQLPYFWFDAAGDFGAQARYLGAVSMEVAGNYIFLGDLGRDSVGYASGALHVYDADTFEFLGVVIGDPAEFGHFGWFDFKESFHAAPLEDGRVMILAEENGWSKNMLYTVGPYNGTPVNHWPEQPPEPTAAAKKLAAGEAMAPDGALTESFWNGLPYEFNRVAEGSNITNTGRFAAAWDDTYLYVGIEVLDKGVNITADPNNAWRGDSVDVYLSLSDRAGPVIAQIVKGYGVSGATVYSSMSGSGLLSWSGDVRDGGGNLIGFTVKMAIPWANIGIIPGNNVTLGFDVIDNESVDGVSRNGQVAWAGTSNNYQSSKDYGLLRLIASDEYTVIYKANAPAGVTVAGYPPVDPRVYADGDSAAVMGGTLRSDGYAFAGWNTKADGTGESRAPGDMIAIAGSDLILYGMWAPNGGADLDKWVGPYSWLLAYAPASHYCVPAGAAKYPVGPVVVKGVLDAYNA
ncbi:MAG: hypothetical protein FWC55_02865, partial [Firmicutes bacterium]|nr:hypothetical protein [Bacillota bacterium]